MLVISFLFLRFVRACPGWCRHEAFLAEEWFFCADVTRAWPQDTDRRARGHIPTSQLRAHSLASETSGSSRKRWQHQEIAGFDSFTRNF